MPNKRTGRDLHIDVPLSNVAIAYRPAGMIADQIAPIINVNKQSDGFYVYDIADAFRTEEDARAPGTEANVMTRNFSSDTYFADNYALMDRIPYEDLENADAKAIFTERGVRTQAIKDKLMLNWEVRLAAQVTNPSNVGSSSAVSSVWTDHVNSDPIGDIITAMDVVEDRSGYRPNGVAMSGSVWRHFREHADVIKRVYGNTTGAKGRIVVRENAKAIFELDRFIIADGYQNVAADGQPVSLSRIWGADVLVYFAPLTARKDLPSYMYSFRWNKIMKMAAMVYQLPKAKAEEIELGYYQDEKITAKRLSFLIQNAV